MHLKMGGDKDTTRGGFFQLFDWTAKSRKKLFPSKSDLPERSKQGKKSHGNLPMTRLLYVDEDDFGAGSSIRGGSDYSCASSVTDEEGYGSSKAPNVVARLMGLDSLPTSSCSDPYSTPFFDTQSLNDVHYHSRNLGFQYDHQSVLSGNLAKNSEEPRPHRIISKPIEKFQTEMLPPKSAKSIPVTHHKLMSPIKSHGYIPAKNAAHIMEAAARIIEGGTHHVPVKGKMPLVGSSSAPIRVRDLKEKVEATQRTRVIGGSNSVPLKVQDVKGKVEATHKPSSAAKNLKEQSLNKSWNGPGEAVSTKPSVDSEEGSSSSSKNKGRSVSLAIQAKVNVQKREGLHTNGSRNSGGLKEDREVKSAQPFKSQRVLQKNSHKKSCANSASTVLRQNNQKQNSQLGKDKLPSKPLVSNSKGRKVQSADPSCGRPRTTSSKSTGSSRSGSRKLGLGEMNNETEVLYSGMKNHPRKKRSISGNFSFEKSQVLDDGVMGKSRDSVQYNPVTDRQFSWDEDSSHKGMDVVSFTFTAPLARSCSESTASFQGKRAMLDSDCRNLSSTGYNVIGGGDALSVLLEQKLKELSYGVECSRRDSIKLGSAPSSELNLNDLVSASNVNNIRSRSYDVREQHALHPDNLSCQYGAEFSSTEPMLEFKQKFQFQGADMDARKFFDFRHPSPDSVLETSISIESCNYSDNADSNSTGSKPSSSSSIQAQEVLSLMKSSKKLHSADSELSDSASSTSCGTMVSKSRTMLTGTYLARSSDYELDYVNDMLHNIDLMFKDFSMGRVQSIMNPLLFDQLESQKAGLLQSGDEGKVERKLLFECVSECLDLRCRQYAGGGCKAWIKGVTMVKRKDCLAEEVCKEISGWRGMGECMVDEIVDKDMSSQFGRWLDFDYQVDAFQIGQEIELQIFNSLVEEVFADVLLM